MAKRPKPDPSREMRELGAKWLNRVDQAGKDEKKWLDDAKVAREAYTLEAEREDGQTTAPSAEYDFNILFSNVETIVPAVINSPPAPDIRRRFGEADPVARVVSDILERAIRVQIDDSRLQTEMESAAQDAFLAGRGIVRLRFKSDIVTDEPTDQEIVDAADEQEPGSAADDAGELGVLGEPAPGASAQDASITDAGRGIGDNGGPPIGPVERLENERVTFEAVSWLDYRHGPAKRWDERPWEAFRFCIPKEDQAGSFDETLMKAQLSDVEWNKQSEDEDVSGWEIWDRSKRRVIFINDNGLVLKIIEDPLGLSAFYAIATPIQPIEVNGRLKPVNPFAVYKRLADDLDDAVRRKNVLIKAMKAKGWYGITEKDMQAVLDLDDNEFVPVSDVELWAQNGGLQNAIAFWPFEKFIAAIQQLDAAIVSYKQMIYEITGISDIVRGASMASETATAQNIKSQWGSLRIQKMQRMMERCARDLFVMMSELIPAKFTLPTLEAMTGIPIMPKPTDAPDVIQQKQAVIQLLRSRLSSYYRIDVESDSTVRADLTMQKQEVAQFLTGAGAYFQAVGPLVQQGVLPADAAMEIFIANARMFKLGRSVEDTLEGMVNLAKQKAAELAQKQNQPPPPSPEQIKAQSLEAADQRKNATEMQKAQMDNSTTWKKAILDSLTKIEVARIQAAADMDSASLAAQLERVLGFDQQQHEVNMAAMQGQQPPAPPMPAAAPPSNVITMPGGPVA